jgi:hypothetical protein
MSLDSSASSPSFSFSLSSFPSSVDFVDFSVPVPLTPASFYTHSLALPAPPSFVSPSFRHNRLHYSFPLVSLYSYPTPRDFSFCLFVCPSLSARCSVQQVIKGQNSKEKPFNGWAWGTDHLAVNEQNVSEFQHLQSLYSSSEPETGNFLRKRKAEFPLVDELGNPIGEEKKIKAKNGKENHQEIEIGNTRKSINKGSEERNSASSSVDKRELIIPLVVDNESDSDSSDIFS